MTYAKMFNKLSNLSETEVIEIKSALCREYGYDINEIKSIAVILNIICNRYSTDIVFIECDSAVYVKGMICIKLDDTYYTSVQIHNNILELGGVLITNFSPSTAFYDIIKRDIVLMSDITDKFIKRGK